MGSQDRRDRGPVAVDSGLKPAVLGAAHYLESVTSDGRGEEPVALRDYFCIADGLTAALLTSRAECHFWCAPRFDSPLRLAQVLDVRGGGSVGITCRAAGPPHSGWEGHSNIVKVSWGGDATVRCALLDDGAGASAICWLVEGTPGLPVDLELVAAASTAVEWEVRSTGAVLPPSAMPDGPGGPLELIPSEALSGAVAGAPLVLPPHGLVIWLRYGAPQDPLSPLLRRMRLGGAAAVVEARSLINHAAAESERWIAALLAGPRLAGVMARAPEWAQAALGRSLLTIRGLQDRNSGLVVASPLTSIPQWPSSERSWDYRYAWLRDCADAGLALCRAGATDEAARLATGLATVLGSEEVAPVSRLDGGPLPVEHVLDYLEGYGGGVVRIGNAAAGQAQVDTLGEVVRFAEALDLAGECPAGLLDVLPALADEAARRWLDPDHGIWEVRGLPRHYVHSKVLAWAALDGALRLAGRDRIDRDSEALWQLARAQLADAIATRGTDHRGRLMMAFDVPCADASTLAAYLVGYLDPGAPATLDYVVDELADESLLARYRPERDDFAAPCAPFIFPALWAVVAEALVGRREVAEARLRSVLSLAGRAGQLSEVAQPAELTMLGNYPQIQSHAAAVEAILKLFGSR